MRPPTGQDITDQPGILSDQPPRMRPPTGQIVVDQRPRTPTGAPPPGGELPGHVPQGVGPMPMVATTVGVPPPPPMFGGQYPNASPRPATAGYDMSKVAARETTIRRLIWIIVLVVAGGVGFIVATQL